MAHPETAPKADYPERGGLRRFKFPTPNRPPFAQGTRMLKRPEGRAPEQCQETPNSRWEVC